SLFPGVRALAPCLGAWLIIYASQTGSSSIKAILSVRPLAFIGVISYSLYLWHWPIIAFEKHFWVSSLGLTGLQSAEVILLSLVMAFLSFEFIESPFRRPNSVWTRWQIFRFGAVASLACAALGLVINVSHGFQQRFDARTQELIAANTERKEWDWKLPHCGHWHEDVHSAAEAASCSIGPGSAKKILFWGDSHVLQLSPSIKRLYEAGALNHHGVLFALAVGCPPAEHMNIDVAGSHCDNFAHFAL